MVTVGDACVGQGLLLLQALAAFLVIEAVAHRLTVGAHHRQAHFGDDAGHDAFDRDGVGNERLDALGAGVIEEGDSRAFACFSFWHGWAPAFGAPRWSQLTLWRTG